jgi:hypothetical protein
VVCSYGKDEAVRQTVLGFHQLSRQRFPSSVSFSLFTSLSLNSHRKEKHFEILAQALSTQVSELIFLRLS